MADCGLRGARCTVEATDRVRLAAKLIVVGCGFRIVDCGLRVGGIASRVQGLRRGLYDIMD